MLKTLEMHHIYTSQPIVRLFTFRISHVAYSAPIRLLGKNANTVPIAARNEHTTIRK